MKKRLSLLHLCTIFMAIIGLNAAVLVGYILFYSTLNGGFASANSGVISSDLASAQENIYEAKASSFPNAASNYLPSESPEEVNANLATESFPSVEYDLAKQKIFDELQNRNGYTYETSLQSENNSESINEIYVPDPYTSQPENPAAIEDFFVSESEIQNPISPGETVWLSAI